MSYKNLKYDNVQIRLDYNKYGIGRGSFPGLRDLEGAGKGDVRRRVSGTRCVTQVKDAQERRFAVKHVHEDKKYKNRELEITAKLNHPNVVRLEESFYQTIGNVASSLCRNCT